MSAAGKFMRRGQESYFHWCPACDEVHPLPDRWQFNGDLDAPTFSPSFKHTFGGRDGQRRCCHYIITAGQINFCGDCTHAMAGQTVPMKEWPPHVWPTFP